MQCISFDINTLEKISVVNTLSGQTRTSWFKLDFFGNGLSVIPFVSVMAVTSKIEQQTFYDHVDFIVFHGALQSFFIGFSIKCF